MYIELHTPALIPHLHTTHGSHLCQLYQEVTSVEHTRGIKTRNKLAHVFGTTAEDEVPNMGKDNEVQKNIEVRTQRSGYIYAVQLCDDFSCRSKQCYSYERVQC